MYAYNFTVKNNHDCPSSRSITFAFNQPNNREFVSGTVIHKNTQKL